MAYTLRGHPAYVTALDFLDGGKQLCSSDQEGWSVWWSLESRRPICIWKSHSENIISTICEGHLVYTHGRDNKLKIWRLESSPFFNTVPPTLASNPKDYQTPWLVHTQDVNALNFCSVAVLGNLFATPSTQSSDKVDVYQLEPFSRPLKALAPEIFQSDMDSDPIKLGIVMVVRLYTDYIVLGFESGHVAIYEYADISDPQLCFLEQLHKDPLQSVTRIDNYIYTSASDRRICRIGLKEQYKHISVNLPHKGTPTITHLNEAIYAACWDGFIRIFSMGLEELMDFKEVRKVSCMAVSLVTPPAKNDGQNTRPRRLVKLPNGFLAVAGKDARISLHPVQVDTNSNLLKLKNMLV